MRRVSINVSSMLMLGFCVVIFIVSVVQLAEGTRNTPPSLAFLGSNGASTSKFRTQWLRPALHGVVEMGSDPVGERKRGGFPVTMAMMTKVRRKKRKHESRASETYARREHARHLIRQFAGLVSVLARTAHSGNNAYD